MCTSINKKEEDTYELANHDLNFETLSDRSKINSKLISAERKHKLRNDEVIVIAHLYKRMHQSVRLKYMHPFHICLNSMSRITSKVVHYIEFDS